MIAGRPVGAAAVILSAGLAGMPPLAAPAWAHGATSRPASRAVLCGPEGGAAAGSAACKAARRIDGATATAAFDDIRVANVNGRDRQRIPDGRLCSGGLARFRGLDLARADWPATKLTAGARFTFSYRVTIPHRGSFRLYATRAGHVPSRPLTWGGLQERPFLTVTNPPRKGEAYVFSGRLPTGLTGRHVIFMVWQTSDTPDTYYSCSDVDFGTRRAAAAGTRPSSSPSRPASSAAGRATPARTGDPDGEGGADGQDGRQSAAAGAAQTARPGTGLRARPASAGSGSLPPLPVIAGAAGLAAVMLGGGLAGTRLRRVRRAGAGDRFR